MIAIRCEVCGTVSTDGLEWVSIKPAESPAHNGGGMVWGGFASKMIGDYCSADCLIERATNVAREISGKPYLGAVAQGGKR